MLEKIEVNNFQDRIEWLWEKVRKQDYYFDDTYRGKHEPFLQMLFQSNSEHYYNESGMVSVVDIQPKVNANIHFLRWDKEYDKKQVIVEGNHIFKQMFDKYELNRITGTIPSFNKGAARIAVLLRMRFEGAIRESFLYKGEYHDVFVYGILRREFEHVVGKEN